MFSCLFKMQVIQLCFIVKKKGVLIFYLFFFLAKGGWASWQVIDFCSARCGIGRKLQFRLCNFPYSTGSASCIGNEVETSICRGPCDETCKICK